MDIPCIDLLPPNLQLTSLCHCSTSCGTVTEESFMSSIALGPSDDTEFCAIYTIKTLLSKVLASLTRDRNININRNDLVCSVGFEPRQQILEVREMIRESLSQSQSESQEEECDRLPAIPLNCRLQNQFGMLEQVPALLLANLSSSSSLVSDSNISDSNISNISNISNSTELELNNTIALAASLDSAVNITRILLRDQLQVSAKFCLKQSLQCNDLASPFQAPTSCTPAATLTSISYCYLDKLYNSFLASLNGQLGIQLQCRTESESSAGIQAAPSGGQSTGEAPPPTPSPPPIPSNSWLHFRS